MSLVDSLLDASIVFSFGRSGYTRHARQFDESELNVDLTERTFVVTGANSGIGFETAKGLAERNAEVFLVCRNEQKGLAAQKQIRADTSNQRIHLLLADLSDHTQVRRLADELPSRINGLVHNAGNMVDRPQTTPQGIELITALHLSGPYLMTTLLTKALQAGATSGQARVIFVSSGGMYGARLEPDRLNALDNSYNGVNHYALTKRGQVVLAAHLHETLCSRGIAVHSMHPGWVDTPALRRAMPRFKKFMNWNLRTPAQGADTLVWLCAAERADLDQEHGFWLDRKREPFHLRQGTRHNDQTEALFMKLLNTLVER